MNYDIQISQIYSLCCGNSNDINCICTYSSDKQYQLQQEISRDSLLTIAHEIIKTDRTCTFITVDKDGKPQARILAYFLPKDDWKIWLGTSTNSRKVAQVKNNPNLMVFIMILKGEVMYQSLAKHV